jgi:hypothetical protein
MKHTAVLNKKGSRGMLYIGGAGGITRLELWAFELPVAGLRRKACCWR